MNEITFYVRFRKARFYSYQILTNYVVEICMGFIYLNSYFQHLNHFSFQDLNKRHGQLNRWVRRGMVPTFNLRNSGRLGQSQPSTIARGQLTSVWLGGLVNPGALLTALRQERAILARADLEDVRPSISHFRFHFHF